MTAPQEGADTTMSIPDRQRDPETGRFVDPDPTDRPVRPTAAQARKLYAELDALNAKVAAQAGQLEDAANLAKSRIETLQGRNKEIQQLKAQAETARRDADGLQVLLATEEEARRALEATANKRQGEIEEWERVAKGYEAALVAEERAGDSAALVGIGIAAIICTSAGWLLRHFAAAWGWLHG